LILDDAKHGGKSGRRLSSFPADATGSANAFAASSMYDTQYDQPGGGYSEVLSGLFQQAASTAISTLWP